MIKQITIKNASNWAKAWRTKNPKMSKAFLIPAQDLTGILKEMGILIKEEGQFVLNSDKLTNAGIRAYLAIDASTTKGNGEKLLLVGTKVDDGNHNDIILNGNDINNKVSGIYDFAKPCPTYCDVKKSPLNK